MSNKAWAFKAGEFAKQFAEKASEVSEAAAKELEKSGLKAKAQEAAETSKQFLDEKGITEKVSKASDTLGEHLDTVSGTAQLKLVEERLELQAQYNDILAEKLEEALKRIDELEKKLAKGA